MTKQQPQELTIAEYRALTTKGGDRKRQKRSAPNVPSAAPGPRDGLSTMIARGWSITVESRGTRLYIIGGVSTEWCEDVAAAVQAAKALERSSGA